MEFIDQYKEDVGFNHKGKRSLTSTKGQVCSIIPMFLICLSMVFAILQWLCYDSSWFWDTNDYQTKRQPVLNRRFAFMKNPQKHNDIVLDKNNNIDMVPMVWYCINAVNYEGEASSITDEDWQPFLNEVFLNQKKEFNSTQTSSIYNSNSKNYQGYGFTNYFGAFGEQMWPDPTVRSHVTTKEKAYENKICWPLEFKKDKEGIWKINTNDLIFPLFKGTFRNNSNHQDKRLVSASLRFSIQPQDNTNVIPYLCKVLTSQNKPHQTKKNIENLGECQKKYKFIPKPDKDKAIQKPKGNQLEWNTVRLSAIPSQIVQMDQFAASMFDISAIENGEYVHSTPTEMWSTYSDRRRSVHFYYAEEQIANFGTERWAGAAQTQQPQNSMLSEASIDQVDREKWGEDARGINVDYLESMEIVAAEVQIAQEQPRYSRQPQCFLDALNEVGGQASVFVALIFAMAGCFWTPYFCNSSIYKHLYAYKINTDEHKHLQSENKSDYVICKSLDDVLKAKNKNLKHDKTI